MARDTVPAMDAGTESTWAPRRCARCGDAFRCGAESPSCWCDHVRLSEGQRARLAELLLEGCLCRRCLESL